MHEFIGPNDVVLADTLIAVALDPRRLPREIAKTLPATTQAVPSAALRSPVPRGGTLATVAFD